MKPIIEVRHLDGIGAKIEHRSQIRAKSWKSEIIHKETRYYFFDHKWDIEYSHVLESCELNDTVCKQFIFIHRLLMSVKLSRNNKKFKRIQVIRGLRCLILPARPHNYLMEYLCWALALLTHYLLSVFLLLT